jgi:hypothetical protein
VDECKPLLRGIPRREGGGYSGGTARARASYHREAVRCHPDNLPPGRGLHSSTFRLNVSAFCGLGGACRGCIRGLQEVSRDSRGCLGCVLC